MAFDAGAVTGSIQLDYGQAVKALTAVEQQTKLTMSRVGTSFQRASGFIKLHAEDIRRVGMSMTVAGGVIAAGLGKAVMSAAEFETQMRNVDSILKMTEAQLHATSAEVIALSTRLPQSAATLAAGLYDIASSGFEGADGLKVLEASAKAASAGMSDTATAARAIAGAINAYGMTAEDSAHISDVLFKTVDRGVITFSELSNGIGEVLASAAAVGVSLEEVGAAIATMTKAGIGSDMAMTALNRIMVTFLNPPKLLAEALAKVTKETALQIIQTKGLAGAVEILNKVSGNSPELLAAMGLEQRSLRAAMSLTRQEGAIYRAELERQGDAAGATQAALERQAKAFAYQWGLMKNQISAAAIGIGQELIPALRPLVEETGKAAKAVAAWVKENPELTRSLVEVAAKVAALMVALGPLLIALPGLMIAIGFVGTALAGLAAFAAPIAIAAVVALAGAITLKLVKAHHAQEQATKEATEAYREHVKEMLALAERAEELAEKKERTKEETDELKKAMARLKDEYPELLRFYSDENDAAEHLIPLLKQLNAERLKTLSIEEAGERRRAAWVGRRITFLSDWIDAQNTELASMKGRMDALLEEGKDVSVLSLEYNLLKQNVADATTELEGLEKELGTVSDATTDVGDATSKVGGSIKATKDALLEATQKGLDWLRIQVDLAKAAGDTAAVHKLEAKYLEALTRVWEKWRTSTNQARAELALSAKEAADEIRRVAAETRAADDAFDAQLATLNALTLAGYDPLTDALIRLHPEFTQAILDAQEMCDTYNALAKTGLLEFQKGLEKTFAAFEKFRDIGIQIITGVKPGVDTVKALTDELLDLQSKLMFDVLSEEDRIRIEARVEAIQNLFADLADDVKETAEEVSPLWIDFANTLQRSWGDAFVQMRREGGRLVDYLRGIWENILDDLARFTGRMVADWLFGIDQMVKSGELGGLVGGLFDQAKAALGGWQAPPWVAQLANVGTLFLQTSAIFAAATGDWRGAIVRLGASILIQKLMATIQAGAAGTMAAAGATQVTAGAEMIAAGATQITASVGMNVASAEMYAASLNMLAAKAASSEEQSWWDVAKGVIPFLQHGAIVTKPILGMVGEAGPEAIIPLSAPMGPVMAEALLPAVLAGVGRGGMASVGAAPLTVNIGPGAVVLSVDDLTEYQLYRLTERLVDPVSRVLAAKMAEVVA